MKLYLILIGVTILFIIRSEIVVGNILYRTSSNGLKRINLSSLFNFLFHPLWNNFLWNIKALDINYIFVISITILLFCIYQVYKNKDTSKIE